MLERKQIISDCVITKNIFKKNDQICRETVESNKRFSFENT